MKLWVMPATPSKVIVRSGSRCAFEEAVELLSSCASLVSGGRVGSDVVHSVHN